MSALAKYYALNGCCVLGYDAVKTDLTQSLESLGIEVFYEDNHTHLPDQLNSAAVTKVVYTTQSGIHTSFDYFRLAV